MTIFIIVSFACENQQQFCNSREDRCFLFGIFMRAFCLKFTSKGNSAKKFNTSEKERTNSVHNGSFLCCGPSKLPGTRFKRPMIVLVLSHLAHMTNDIFDCFFVCCFRLQFYRNVCMWIVWCSSEFSSAKMYFLLHNPDRIFGFDQSMKKIFTYFTYNSFGAPCFLNLIKWPFLFN